MLSFILTFFPDECQMKSFEKMNTLLSAIFKVNKQGCGYAVNGYVFMYKFDNLELNVTFAKLKIVVSIAIIFSRIIRIQFFNVKITV